MTEARLNPLRDTFASPFDQYRDRIGQPFRLLGAVDPRDYDYNECGPMFCIEFPDGAVIDAWPEEVFDHDSGALFGASQEIVARLDAAAPSTGGGAQ